MKQVEVCAALDLDSLEKRVNRWLKNNMDKKVIDIQYSTSFRLDGRVAFSVMIFYEEYKEVG